MEYPNKEYPTDAESTPEQIYTPSTPVWVFAFLIGLGLLMIGLVWWFGVLARPASETAAETGAPVAPQLQVLGPERSTVALIPTPTPSPLAAVSPLTATQSVSETAVPLPTITPTPFVELPDPRTAEISGFTTLRLKLSNAGFASSGNPLRFTVDTRTHTLAQDGSLVADSWCLQMGVHLLQFDLGLALNPANHDLLVNGTITLHSGFCADPGPALDTVPVELAVPADASARIAYSLNAEQKLLDVADLLNADVGVTVELIITNPRQG